MRRHTTFTSVKVIAVGLLTMLASMLGAGTALAHSVVIGSTPENGAEIASGPERVSVTFNEALQESFASLTVVGPDGNLWTKSDPVVEGPTVSAELGELGPAGVYTVAFRVTSADGHPVSGTRTFTLTQEGSGTPGAAADSSGESGGGGVPLWPFIVAGVVVFGGGLWFALRKPRGEN
ncbi:copper resistance protein CopC [Rhodococcus pseudokoreensis]|uniref:Copper resistance protein CopC n=1 Tax=Rhodococcus pseudokoreensis TaxID=2811421 RepID=A0A974W642_9NOCA|nr:copper resistance CopC family protein [Rhodococcus pseudokoreensis]QSE91312.1 copper resistance protein CopC [Rhodococcus pseudokoreensis]